MSKIEIITKLTVEIKLWCSLLSQFVRPVHLNTDHIQSSDQRQLHSIIDDHADEHDITWIFIEEAVLSKSGHHAAVKHA